MADLLTFIGALVPTFLIGRLMLWAVGKLVPKSLGLLCIANGTAFAIVTLILYLGDNLRMILAYAAAQAFWLALDVVRAKRKTTGVP